MKNSIIPLAIILKRTQNGYTFESLQEVNLNKDKNKKSKFVRKPPQKGAPNRLIKQICVSNDPVIPQITTIPEPQPQQHLQQQQQQNAPVFQQVPQEEQIFCEVDRQTQLPKTPAIWFDKLKIHEIQKRQMKQFFIGSQSKTPQLYMKYRNFIIQSYDKNPKRYLTKISCRRILRGDVNTIMRVHQFLQRQGIINFALNYDGNYTFKQGALTKSHEPRNEPQTVLKSLPEQDQETAEKQIDTDNMTITVINKNFSRTYRACCSECKLICGILWFANVNDDQSATQRNLCFDCWSAKDETQKNQYAKVDIVKKMQAHGRDGKNFPKNAWNIEENIKLLDFMSNGQKSWRKLLNDFGGKRTIEDIVLQFLQFPISNVEIKKSKRQLEKHLVKKQDIAKNLGYCPNDYKQILQNYFENSEYNKKKTKIQQNGHKAALQNNKIQQIQVKNDKSQQIGQMLTLTMDKIMSKIQCLKQQQQLVRNQTTNYDSLISYKINKIKPVFEDQPLQKSTNEIQNKSKSLKNYPQKKNQSSQFIDDLEGEVDEPQV